MSERGSGRTTRQIEALPVGGYFIVANDSMATYTKHRARDINRSDIRVLTVAACERTTQFMGLSDFVFAVDHATDDVVEASGGFAAMRRWEEVHHMLRQIATAREMA